MVLKEIVRYCTKPAPGVVSVIASAGAGKTYTLTAVYISLLLRGIQPDSILAITFTNKSAEEMRRRVIDALMDVVYGERAEEFADLLGVSEDDVREKAKGVLASLVFDYSRVHIQTIDSFLNRLRMSFSFELGLSPYSNMRTSIRSDIDLIVSYALERAKSDRTLLRSIYRFVGYFSRSLAVYRGWDPIGYAQWLFPIYLEKQSHLGKEIEPISPASLKDLIKEVLYWRDEFLRRVDASGVKLSNRAMDALGGLDDSVLASVKDVKTAFLNLTYTDYEAFRKGVLKGKVAEGPSRELYEVWLRFLGSFNRLDEAFSRSFPAPFMYMYSAFKAGLDDLRRRKDITYLPLIQLDIANLDPDLVAERLSARFGKYSHFLIDEFQDTSLSQWSALRPVFEEALASGGLLFCVGDPKQTIYRWRGSHPDMFGMLREAFPFDFKEFVLDRNWRSAKEIVAFNNELFSGIVDRLPEDKEGSDILLRMGRVFSEEAVAQRAVREDEGQVASVTVQGDPSLSWSDYEDMLIEKLVDYLRDSPEGERAILVRRREEARKIIARLTVEGISAISEESMTLVGHPVVMALVTFLRYLAYPEEEMFLKGVILSEVWACFTGKPLSYWQEELRLRGSEHFRRLVSEVLESAVEGSIYRMVINLMRRLRIQENFPDQDLFISAFLDLLWDWESRNGAFVKEFLRFWEYQEDSPVEAERVVLPFTSSAVRVMTIHSAKGLEFDEVILPFLDVKIGDNRSPGLQGNLFWGVEENIRVYYINSHMARRHPALWELYRNESHLRIWDDVNLLYVALTRARRKLTLFLTDPSRHTFSWQEMVRPMLVEEGGEG